MRLSAAIIPTTTVIIATGTEPAVAAIVAAETAATASLRPPILTDVDELTGNLGITQTIEETLGQVFGKTHDREVLANIDRADLRTLNTALVCKRAHNGRGFDPSGTAYGEFVVHHAFVAVVSSLLGPAFAAVLGVVGESAGFTGNIVVLIEEEGATMLCDDGERGGDVFCRGVVLVFVVFDDLAEEV